MIVRNIKLIIRLFNISIITILLLWSDNSWSSGYPAPGKGCISKKCHEGIEPIRDHNTLMSKQIFYLSEQLGDPNGCVVCHGGKPHETENKDIAHKGAPEGGLLDAYVPFPGSMWIIDKTCGKCHPKHVYAMHRSVMNTEAGKIQGALWGWGASTGYEHRYGNYNIEDSDGPEPVFGTETYRGYTRNLMKKFPDVFPVNLIQLPVANLSTIKKSLNRQYLLIFVLTACDAMLV